MFSASKSGQYGGYQISRSVRLRSSASAYFNRTPASAGNRKTWTWSGWVKRGALGSAQILMSSDVGTSNATWLEFGFDAADTFTITSYTTDSNTTSAVFRDPSAWYHVVVQFDSTQATAANRCRIYVNGVQQTLTGAGFTLNADYGINNNQIHDIGRRNWASGVGRYLDGYLTEINFIDGQALTPSSFGVTNAYGVWSPIKYNGTYGTNGFYLNFSDNSGATATTIGKDSSGNGNNWTPNNISVTAGATYDSMLDVPTPWGDGGNGRGNYATLNPVNKGLDATITNGNLAIAYGSSSSVTGTPATIGVTSGKWYWEVTPTGGTGANATIGIVNTTMNSSTASGIGFYVGYTTSGWSYAGFDGNKRNGAGGVAYGATFTTNDVIGVAFDADAGTLTFYKNNVSQGTAFTGLTSGPYFPAVGDASEASTVSMVCNFGQRPFTYTPPSGFKALNTFNLPTPTILKGNQFFDATTYTGTGAARSVTNGGFQPDFIWIKDRSVASAHALANAVTGFNKYLESNTTVAETTDNTSITAVNADGFTLGAGTATYYTNRNGEAFVAWQWKEGATQGFDIVTYTGNATNRTIAHNLGVAPKMIIVKSRSQGGTATYSWAVWHSALAGTEYLLLNGTAAKATAASVWNSTIPTSSVFSLGTDSIGNGNAVTYVAYLFAEVAGFSKFGSYTGNGSTDGPFVFCGFRPRFVMIKRTDVAADWVIYDSARDTYNVEVNTLYPNLSNAEGVVNPAMDFVSNGIKLRNLTSTFNASGGTYIFAAFAESPFKFALAR